MELVKHRINRVAMRLALLSFVSGSIVFLLYLATQSDYVMGIGFFFLFLAFACNSGVLLVLFISALVNHRDLKEHVTAMVLVLLNIPIASLYINLLFPF